ncbi:hypothetical protein QYM36_019410 [Artemia franciscana]|uniref:BTB domain-containing protein n=1 Tax=Artemia franciscana TaxID=6661 RepID=A0AA88H176_ARTSF|nr:hypothetical protein QYM36_019410 [Artemia franciscana]KAK2701949.1 hypothetical protein QYM36_019410 [Artemia franciscana]KAK2701951.1 hypothetical protein QYM36_019410 [Artemia franciscana]
MDIGEQEFRLKWNNHQPTLIAVLDRLLVNQTLVDITLAAEGQTLKAHKLVLSACSPFFHDLLSNYTGRDMVVFLKDVRFVELQALIDYMYKGEVSIAQHNLASLIQTAESLKIKGLAEPDDLSRRAPPPPPPPLHKINIVSSQSPKSEYKKVSADYPVGVPNFGSVCMKRRRVDVPDSSVSEVDKEKEVVGVNGSDELNSSKPKSETSFSEDEGAEDEWSENEISNTQEGEDSQGQWQSAEDATLLFTSESQGY